MNAVNWLVLAVLTLTSSAAAADEAGRAAFEASNCATCHAVEALGIAARVDSGPDLGKAAGRDAAWLRSYLARSEPGHPVAFKGDDEALDALVRWIRSLGEAG